MPRGTKWDKKKLIFFKLENIIYPSQIGKDRAIVIDKWLVAVNVYGNRPMKFEKTININNDIMKWDSPGVFKDPIDELNSLFKYWAIKKNNFLNLLKSK